MHRHIIRWVSGVLAVLILSLSSVQAQSSVQAVVVNEFENIRVSPAIGASVINTVQAGYLFDTINARSGDGQWVRIEYECNEGWVHLVPMVVLQGDPATLPIADPRSIPYGGFESPRSGYSQQQGSVLAEATDGLRIRSGPSRAYPTLANINFSQQFTITGRNNCGTWFQVNFEGNLGWVSSAFVQILNGDVNLTPVGGIAAETAPRSGESEDDYIATLRFMLDRLDIAQQSLDAIRASWTDAALIGRAICQAYPPRPTNFQIPTPQLAAYYTTLNPLLNDFNEAMYNTRYVIDMFIEVCNQPGTANPVGQATVQGALGIINQAEQQYASLRQRLNDLIPDFTVGADECLLRYNKKFEVVPRISLNTIYLDSFTRRTLVRGYCFDGFQNQVIDVQTLPIPPAELEVFVSVSAMDDPTKFLLVSRSSKGARQVIGPLILPRTTTYLVIMADLGEREGEPRLPFGDFAFKLSDLTLGATTVQLIYWDDATKSVQFEENQTAPQIDPATGIPGVLQPPVVCPSLSFTCDQFFTCAEAQACYDAGNFSLDGNSDGIPCETLCN